MVTASFCELPELPELAIRQQRGYRLINSKYPPIALFDDVADEHDFKALYDLQALTNPRLNNDAGNLNYLSRDDIPFGIAGCAYAVGPFTHINPLGSRFSNGSFGVLYLAQDMPTALAEVGYHQGRYWRRVAGLKYDRLVMRGLAFTFDAAPVRDALGLPPEHPVYDPDDYSVARRLGGVLKQNGCAAIRYRSVRYAGAVCWGLFSPRGVTRVVQSSHYEFIWQDGRISEVNRVVSAGGRE
ncbi:RES family NAD+ phosphorylase [Martelella alba]|uniref:RES domain-containing protein n=1 Tax=Martelella alba TaxID=2590451 RepID=A0ABY2SSS6_9HYPH|nr:RES family NAD+ phosphorylase [Martelella alba]TKI08063.1 RES domain-containing protein [Martelella alba]